MPQNPMSRSAHPQQPPIWRQPDGKPIACVGKIKVLNQNFGEIESLCQEALEDALLMGCDETQVRAALHDLIESLTNPYREPERA